MALRCRHRLGTMADRGAAPRSKPRCRRPDRCCRPRPADLAAPARRSALWRAQCWPAAGAGQQPVVADAVKPLRQNVEEKAHDELAGRQRHRAIPRPLVATIVLVPEGDAAFVKTEQPVIGDGDAVSVGGEIGKHRLGPGEGWFGVDEPVLPPQRREVSGEGPPVLQPVEIAKERQPARPPAVSGANRSSGLVMLRIVVLATRV